MPAVRPTGTPALRFVSDTTHVSVRLVAAHAQRKYSAFATTLGYGRFPACRHLTLFLAYRALRGESVQYQTVHRDDVEMQLHRPFLSCCETVLDADGCRDPCEYKSLKGVGCSGRRIAQIAETAETRRPKKVLDDATQMVV